MTILSIETSCDETSIAIVKGDRLIASRTYSQVKHHKAWQGVHPSVARRAHAQRLPILLNQILKTSKYQLPLPKHSPTPGVKSVHKKTPGVDLKQPNPETLNLLARNSRGKPRTCIEAIAVTVGPGLPPALEEGIKFAKSLALKHGLPLIPVNHLEGHLASIFLKRSTGTPFTPQPSTLNPQPSQLLNLIVSGGHTELVVSRQNTEYRKSLTTDYRLLTPDHSLIGQTLDDAAGEVLDKVGRELGLGYPAGPVIEQLAKEGNPHAYKFPLPLKNTPKDNLDFSFSGLKTKAIQMLHNRHDIPSYTKRVASHYSILTPHPSPLTPQLIADFAASFQQAVIDAILFKVRRALNQLDKYSYNVILPARRYGGERNGSEAIESKSSIRQFENSQLPSPLAPRPSPLKPVLTFSGGVAANLKLRKQLRQLMKQHNGILLATHKKFTGDNAAMIGLAAQWAATRGEIATTKEEIESIDRQPNLNFPLI